MTCKDFDPIQSFVTSWISSEEATNRATIVGLFSSLLNYQFSILYPGKEIQLVSLDDAKETLVRISFMGNTECKIKDIVSHFEVGVGVGDDITLTLKEAEQCWVSDWYKIGKSHLRGCGRHNLYL